MEQQTARLRALSRNKRSLLACRLRRLLSVHARPLGEGPAGAAPDVHAIDDVGNLSNDEVNALLTDLLANEGPDEILAILPPISGAATAAPDVDTSDLSDDDVTAMLAEMLGQDDTTP